MAIINTFILLFIKCLSAVGLSVVKILLRFALVIHSYLISVLCD